MFWRPDRKPTEPIHKDAKSAENERIGSLEMVSSEESSAMPAVADKLESTRYAPPPSFGEQNSQRKTGQSAMRFTYSTGDQPLRGFTIKRGIGVGGFGEVYFAISEAGKEVAIKRVQRNLDVELRGVSHCMNLKHPNLVSLYDTRYDDTDQAWVVMEYVPGETLRDVLDQYPQGLNREAALRWFGDLAAGVTYLHEHGIVHRDLKPGNVFDDEGIVKIGDYGLSKFISCSRRGGHTESVGTFHYMAPEIGRGEYGKEIDIYALGIMLFEMLTGNVPFNGESSQEIIMKHLTSDPDLSGVEQPFRDVIAKALQKNPGARQQNVHEMLAPLGIGIDKHGLARFGEPLVVPSPKPASEAFADKTKVAMDQLHDASTRKKEKPNKGPREPIADAVSKSAHDFRNWWRDHRMSPVARALVAVGICVALMMNSAWLIPAISLLGILYIPYYVVRTMILTAREQPSYATAHAMAVAEQQQRNMQPTAEQWRATVRHELAAKPLRTRAAELSESWMTSLVVVALLGWVATMFGVSGNEAGPAQIAPFVWGAMTTLAGTWMMLAMGKLWEREEGEGLPRRIMQLGMGAAVGALSYGLAKALFIPLNVNTGNAVLDLPEHMYAPGGELQLPAMMAYFAATFFLVRWWRTADPLRPRRLSVWSVACVVVVAWGVNQFIPVPQPWGMLSAGATCVAIQMAAGWRNPLQRLQPAKVA